jgi:excisionase family DNA binding protein
VPREPQASVSQKSLRPGALEAHLGPMLTVKQVAASLSVSTAHIYKLTKLGELPHVRVLNAIRIRPADLEAFIEARASRPRRRKPSKRRRRNEQQEAD